MIFQVTNLIARQPRALPFEWSFHFFTFATVFWAFFTLASTGELHIAAVLGFIAAFALSLFRKRIGFRLPLWIWNGVSVIVFIVACYGWFALGQRMYAVTYFLLYLEAYKLLTAAKPRDYMQIYGLSFFHMLAASVSTTSLFFGPMLAVYLLLVMAALITFTIRRDAERAFAVEDGRGPAMGGWPLPHRLRDGDALMLERIHRSPYLDRRFLLMLPMLTLSVLGLGILIFWMVPRMAKQNFFPGLGGASDGPRTSGFADQISFGIVGEIQKDPTIVMRATLALQDRDKRQQYLRIRGTSLDLFTGDNWILASDTGRQSFQEEGRRARILADQFRTFDPAAEDLIRVRVTLEPEKSGYLFLPDRPLFVEFDERTTYEVNRLAMSLKARASRYQPVSYTVTSHVQSPVARLVANTAPSHPSREPIQASDLFRESSERLGLVGKSFGRIGWELLLGGDRPRVGDVNLLLPEESPDVPTIRETAAAWTAGLTNPLEMANEIERRFKSEFDYSLEIPFSRERNHISRFLTVERRGHCEYFATSMVLMLRSLGVPARIVNGYLTDEWNEAAGGRFLVRQEHAHSWVEAQVDNSGEWMMFDPTPSSGVGSNRIRSGLYHWYSALYDVLKMAWYDAVIDFDHQTQRERFVGALRMIDKTLTRIRQSINRLPISIRGDGAGTFNAGAAAGWFLIVISVAGTAILLLGVRGAQWRRASPLKTQEMSAVPRADLRPYHELLEALERQVPRRSSVTPLTYARLLDGQAGERLRDFVHLTERYYDARYNGGTWTVELTEQAAQLRDLSISNSISLAGNQNR